MIFDFLKRKRCICGRKGLLKKTIINDGKKICLCPHCSYLIMRDNIIKMHGEQKFKRILLIMNEEDRR